tara:strand:- start:127 stop:441 length:315 start_codon:yes stop_codon:yes gene_type:complete
MNPDNLKFAEQMAKMFAAPGSAINGIYGEGMKVEFDAEEVIISGTCVVTGRHAMAVVPLEGWTKFTEDRTRSISECWTGLSRNDVEWLRTGISRLGWEQTFGKE